MKKNILVLALLSAIATPTLADNTGTFYGALDYGSWNFSNTNPGGSDFPNPGMLRFSAGYHFTPMLAIEGGYAMIGDSTIQFIGSSATAKSSAVQMAAVGTYHIDETLELFGKLGFSMTTYKLSGTAGLATLNTSNSSTSLMYGIGAQYNINKQWGIRAQYEDFGKNKFSSNLTKLSWDVSAKTISIGAVLNF